MATAEELIAEAANAIQQLLNVLCRDSVHVGSQLTQAGTSLAIDLIATASPADEAALQAQGADGALLTIASAIGARSGIATVSFQFG